LVSGIFSEVEESAIGDSGGIDLTTTNLSLTRGASVDTTTFGSGNAGAITIKASGTISADGEGTILANVETKASSGIFSTAGDTGEGNAAGININTNNLSLTKGAEISVESSGQGNAGNLFIQANSLALENGASLLASTPIGTGGNITLQIADNLTLRDNSTISAQATEDANGGNIDINADFVIAFPNQNNDIIASAEQGNGGNIDISTRAIFGIEERSSIPINNTNDLDASSEFGLDGTIAINQLDINPAETLEELPTSVIDVTRSIAQSLCQQLKGSEFIVTGTGGIAPNPSQVRGPMKLYKIGQPWQNEHFYCQ
jgi:large exoprotein involved in heme utilization and adhesion